MVYLAAATGDINAARAYKFPLAYMSRRVGEPHNGRGGMMIYSHTGDNLEPASAGEITAECRSRGYTALLLDFEGEVRQNLAMLASQLSDSCARAGIALIVNKRYMLPNAVTLVSSAQVSGSLRHKLLRYGENAMLEIERLAQDIILPSPQGRGTSLSRTQLTQLLESRTTFFSNELLARYFTYKDSTGATHFVVYDDAATISKKLALADSLGLYGAVMLYSEVKDILAENPQL